MPIACDDTGQIEIVLPPGKLSDGGNLPDAGWSDGDHDGDAGDPNIGDASAFPVYIGITPNPPGDGPPAIGDVVAARLTMMASGSRAVVVRRMPSELTSEAAWMQLEAELNAYVKKGMKVQFVFAVVDGNARGLESDLLGYAWNDPFVLNALAPRIDRIAGLLGGSVPYFLFGRDVDAFLVSHPDERIAFEELVTGLIAYVREHALVSQVGVGFSFSGATLPDPSWGKLFAASDVAACSYLPGLGTNSAGSATNIAMDADKLINQAQGKPIVLEALGYPTSSVVGGSEAKQALFLQTFFTVLGPRRANFAFVNIEGLHDLAPGRCAARATSQGQAVDGSWAAFACSVGLFTADSQPKPAWQDFINGAAAFASP